MKEEIKTKILSTETCHKPYINALKWLFELFGTNKKCPNIFALDLTQSSLIDIHIHNRRFNKYSPLNVFYYSVVLDLI